MTNYMVNNAMLKYLLWLNSTIFMNTMWYAKHVKFGKTIISLAHFNTFWFIFIYTYLHLFFHFFMSKSQDNIYLVSQPLANHYWTFLNMFFANIVFIK